VRVERNKDQEDAHMISSKHIKFTALCLLMSVGSVQAWASTGDAGFIGGNYEISPSANGTTAAVQVAGIRNTTANATSGSLGFELWYSSTPYSGGTIDGYKVAASYLPIGNCTSSQLGPGQSCTAIAVTDTLTLPPAGTYYPVLLLVEFSSTCVTNGGYCIDDFVDLTNLVTGGPTIAVGGVDDGGSGSTGNAEMAGPIQVSAIDWTANTVDITAESVTNIANVTSGSLAIQLWFMASPYTGGAISSGYKVASFPLPASCTTGHAQLNAGMSCDSINSGTVSVTPPPAGTYYAAVVLAEYNPNLCPSNAGYCIDNGLALQNQETVPDPIAVTGIAGADSGGGGGGALYWLDVLALAALVAISRSRKTVVLQFKQFAVTGGGLRPRAALMSLVALIAVCGLSGCGGGGAAASPAPPTITAQPASTAVNPGQTATFSVTATGAGTLTYQWEVGGAVIAGATSATYMTPAVTAQNNGAVYSVIVTNSGGNTASGNAILTVNTPPAISGQPSPLTVNAGQTATFSVTASGTGNLTYQWKRNASAITGASSSSYTTPATTSANNGDSYSVDVTNGAGTTTSTSASLRVTGLSLVAGQVGGPGYVDGPVAQARFEFPNAVATDSHGNVFVADNMAIREITPSGTVSTIAGSPTLSGAVDASGAAARFSTPLGITVDAAGNIYIADTGNSTIRVISSMGAVSTLAGKAGNKGSVDGAAANARFSSPIGIAYDNNSSTVYVSDTDSCAIRTIQAGTVTTIAGPAGGAIDGSRCTPVDGAATGAGFAYPTSLQWEPAVATPPSGAVLLVADLGAVRAVIPGPDFVVTVAGNVSENLGVTNGPALTATFDYVNSIASDTAGDLYIADLANNDIRVINGNPAIVSTIAGTSSITGSANGTGAAAAFNAPYSVATDPAGNVFVADNGNSQIRKITPGGVVTTYAGGATNYGHADGAGSAASFSGPRGIVKDGTGNLYVADDNNHTIRKITPAGVVTTLAGMPGQAGEVDGSGSTARFNAPHGLAIDAAGNLYVADYLGGTIRVVSPTGVVTTLAGSASTYGEADGVGTAALFAQPIGIAVDTLGNVYVTDNSGDTVRKITPVPAAVVSTIGGTGFKAGSIDGVGAAALFDGPIGIAVDSKGNVFVGDSGNATLRVITPGGNVTTIAGTAKTVGWADGTGAAAEFADLFGLALDSAGNVYVADRENAAIRKVVVNSALTSGTVTTVVGAPSSATRGITLGALPGQLNLPWGVAMLSTSPTTLVVTDQLDNSIVRIDLP
jgi:sugar lactone lactonase YvrE